MIVPRDIKPERSLYVIGASLIKTLREIDSESVSLEDLYKKYRTNSSERISYNYFTYAVDWLFLLGLVKVGERPTEIEKCF